MVLLPNGALLALADGLGHGPLAAVAARAFCTLARERATLPLVEILQEATLALSGTRGAAAALWRVDFGTARAQFAGIGNIELVADGAQRIRPVSLPGIIGRPLRKVVAFDFELRGSQVVIAHTDGVSTRFELEAYRTLGAQSIADTLIADHGKWHDDATCVAMRFELTP